MGGSNKKKNAKKRDKQNADNQKGAANLDIPKASDNLTASVSATSANSRQSMQKNAWNVTTVTGDLTPSRVPKGDTEVNKGKTENKQDRKFKVGSNRSFSTGTSDSLDRRSDSAPALPIETSQVEAVAVQEDCNWDDKPQENTVDNTLTEDTFFETESCFNDTARAGNIDKSNQKGNKSYAQTIVEKPVENPDRNKGGERRVITYDSSNGRSSSTSSQSKSSYSCDTNDSWGHCHNSSKYEDSSKFDKLATKNSNVEYIKVEEIEGDLFSMPAEYSLGHCVAEDMNMGSGIAVGFRQTFKRIDELLQQRAKQGGLAVLDDNDRFIYYLVTKTVSNGKPTYETLEKSLQKMKEHIVMHNVKKLALPRLGCGLDRLEWSEVKKMLESTFSTVDIIITVCNFQQTFDAPAPAKLKKCHVVNVSYSIEEIERLSIIIYLGSEDHHVTKEIERLDEKFRIIRPYKYSTEKAGQIIRTEVSCGDYMLYGCIVRKKFNDPFSYTDFQKSLGAIQRNNRKDRYEYVGIQAVQDDEDSLFMDKIVNLIRNTLTHVDVYVCGQPEWKSKDQY